MADDFEFADKVPPSFDRVVHSLARILISDITEQMGNVIKDSGSQGFNPGLIVLLVVGGLLLTFIIGNYVLYSYAQKTLPPRKKKPVSKKKMKREKLKQGRINVRPTDHRAGLGKYRFDFYQVWDNVLRRPAIKQTSQSRNDIV
ncbi:DNA-binding protein S1FA2, partial [Mucuna pruriens]